VLKSSSHSYSLSNCTPEGQASQVTQRVQPVKAKLPTHNRNVKSAVLEGDIIP
jgi:ribosomal protein S28E/S33